MVSTTPNQARTKAEEELFELQAEFCKGMAHPKRIYILNLLKGGEKTVNVLARLTGIPQANVSQHLGVLRQLGIVDTRRNGSSVYYSIGDHRVVEACELVRGSIGERLRKSRAVLEVTA
ncbi:MAG: helix-turn-helix transcriptional regulator [Nitrososphaerota archaeon]|nr:helix-turn-helix transcriptional regulator [Nitrososphaerota archaeon]